MELALEVEEEEEWARGPYSEEPADENCAVGEEALERAAAGMGGRVVAPPLLALVQQFMGRPDWQHRRAAVAGLARLAEGATAQCKALLPQVRAPPRLWPLQGRAPHLLAAPHPLSRMRPTPCAPCVPWDEKHLLTPFAPPPPIAPRRPCSCWGPRWPTPPRASRWAEPARRPPRAKWSLTLTTN